MSTELLAAIVLGGLLLAAIAGLVMVSRSKREEVMAVKAEADKQAREAADLRQRFSGLVDLDAEIARKRAAAEEALRTAAAQAASESSKRDQLAADYAKAKALYDSLNNEVHSLEENLEDISFGIYKPHYKFDTPEQYKEKLDDVCDKQKEMVREGKAARFEQAWSVGGSLKEGERMQKQYVKLMLRAFNGECDAAVAKVTWSNISKMEERVSKAFEAINSLGSVMTVSISPKYRDLKLAELRLEHELEEEKRQIVEEQKRIREEMREEEKLQKEVDRAQADAEAESTRFQKALDKARVDFAKTQGAEHARLNDKILELEQQLAEASTKVSKAKAMAELTKAGYVYVISNVGSFGEDVFKIGLTRRLDPMDRVKELGDASVPFTFDVHAMVYSEDAPALENALHQKFAERRMNLVNYRKEFFRVRLDEIEGFAKQQGFKMAFTKLAEAREFRESIAIRQERGNKSVPPVGPKTEFPSAAFAGGG